MLASNKLALQTFRIFFIASICAAFVLLASVGYLNTRHPYARISFLNVGQGDAIFLRLPDETTVLIDGGPDNSVLYELGPLMPWWKHTIDYVVITHGDKDHYFGIFGILQKYHVGKVLYNGAPSTDLLYNELLSQIKQQNIPLVPVVQGEHMDWSWGGHFSMLWPVADYTAPSDNQKSVAIKFTWGNESFLLMADVPQAEEQMILRDYPTLSAAVLKAGHHGSNGSSGSEFLAQVGARWCVISAGAHNSYHHPHPDVLARLGAANCQIESTIDHGTISFVFNERRIRLLQD